MMEAGLAFQQPGKGGRGMKAESTPPQLQRWSCGSWAAGCTGVTFPFPPPTSCRGETDLLCAVISSIRPVNLEAAVADFMLKMKKPRLVRVVCSSPTVNQRWRWEF